MQVFKVDDSLAVRLPKAVVDELGLKEGDEVSLVPAGNGVLAVETREERRRRAIEHLASLNWTLPPDYKFDRDEANER
jgi:antitoxin MazE